MLREQVLAIRAGAAAQVAMADAIRAAMNGSAGQPPGECQHPPEKRQKAARMGVPDAWVCACGAQGDE